MIYVHVWGNHACFSNPLSKVERYTYPVITPSAARGILEAILYKPEFRWEVRKIAVLSPIKEFSFRKNEVQSKISFASAKSAMNTGKPMKCIDINENRTQRVTIGLRDVEYIIGANIVDVKGDSPTCCHEKYLAMATRYIEQGKCQSQPFLGQREFICHFKPATEADLSNAVGKNPDKVLGFMVYDCFNLNTKEQLTTLYSAELKNGIINVPTWYEIKKLNFVI